MSIKGTKTEQNLLKAFAGESQARSRYTLWWKSPQLILPVSSALRLKT